MEVAFSLFFSGMVISNDKQYGPIGIIFALMAFLIAIGIVVILGAVVGIVWQERALSFTAAFKKMRRAGDR
jgi:membrane protein